MFGYPFHASIATPPSFTILEINYLATLIQACFRPTHLKAIVNLETRRRKRKKGRVTGKERGKKWSFNRNFNLERFLQRRIWFLLMIDFFHQRQASRTSYFVDVQKPWNDSASSCTITGREGCWVDSCFGGSNWFQASFRPTHLKAIVNLETGKGWERNMKKERQSERKNYRTG